MSPTYSVGKQGRRYPYYVSQALLQNGKERAGSIARLPAEEIERLVGNALGDSKGEALIEEALRKRLERVTVSNDRVEIVTIGDAIANGDETPERRTIVVQAKLAHRNRARVLDDGSGGPNPLLMRALGRAHAWRGWMERGEAMSYRAIAKKAGVNPGYVQTILPLAFLAPALTRELLDGRRQLHGPLMVHMREGVPASWSEQADRL